MKKAIACFVVIGALVTAESAAAAPITGTYTTGGATVGVGSGPFTMTSTDATFSILRFVLDTPTDFGSITDLSIAYNAVLGGIAAGAPRVAVVIDSNGDLVSDGSFLIHWGPAGSFADPTLGPGNTGNLLALTDNGRYDLGGIGGAAYTDRAAALAIAANWDVLRFSIVLDSFGGNDRNFTFGVDPVSVQGAAVPEPATALLLGTGLVAFARAYRKRRQLA